MKNIITLVIFLLSIVTCYAQENKGVQFMNINYQQALEKADKDGKMVFLNYSTKGCGPCKVMEQTVYVDAEIAKNMNEKFVCIKLDPIKNRSLEKMAREEHGVKGFPTLIFLKSDGTMLLNVCGFKDKEELNQLIDKAYNTSI